MMSRILVIYFLMVVIATTLLAMTLQPKKIRVFLIGDSTMSLKMETAYPETGWGMPFSHFFDSTVAVENHAKNGRSTRTFINEGLWSFVGESLRTGDYVFIQFGHNDESKEKTDRYTTPEQYEANLLRFVEESRQKGAIPVLITPVSRRKFEKGKQMETHAVYSDIVRKLASKQKTAFIDLDLKSRMLYQQMGEENSRLLFLQLEPGEHPNYPDGKIDNTHFNELGARKVAQLVLQEIIALRLELAERIVKRKGKT